MSSRPKLCSSMPFFDNETSEFAECGKRLTLPLHTVRAIDVISDLDKSGIRFRGAIEWNAAFTTNINIDVSERVYVKFLKRLINENANKCIDYIVMS